MPLFKVTEKKLEECLGEPYQEYCHPWKSKRIRYLGSFFLGGGSLLVLLLYLSRYVQGDEAYRATILKIVIPVTLVLTGLILLVAYFLLRQQFFQEVTGKMKDLVNDPQLSWLNFSEGAPSTPSEKKIIFKRHTYPFEDSFFYALSYLKRQKTDYGMEWKTWKNNSSARVLLSRLAKKGIVSVQGGDYQYEEWRFRIIDECGRFLESPEYVRKETLLNKAWERMMEKGNIGGL